MLRCEGGEEQPENKPGLLKAGYFRSPQPGRVEQGQLGEAPGTLQVCFPASSMFLYPHVPVGAGGSTQRTYM